MNSDSRRQTTIGRRIGPYQVIQEIGRGGMGAVYLAVRVDAQFEKRVAIKLVKRGMDTEDILRRFYTERQILANLNHPNVAKLLDGGTTEDGRPYFVMDYVEGIPIDQYCDQRRLSIAQRLSLFRTVCSAVHYAHQNLIVHRDLKAGNVLVTSAGVPVLLDFGIAKLLNPARPSQTAVGMRALTPECASPEQAQGQPITTSSDVYSLGVLLYRLLTGHLPFRFRSSDPYEMMQVVCSQEPEMPSAAILRTETVSGQDPSRTPKLTPQRVSHARGADPEKLRRELEGDLDTIVLKAMQKDPLRRYASVDQFSDDVRRYLEGLPVIAQRDTLAYRLFKFVARNKIGVAAAVLVALSLLGGIIATTWEAHIAARERTVAERRFNDVRRLANSFLFEIQDALAKLPGSTPARGLLVGKGLQYLDNLSKDAADNPALQRDLAVAYQKVGDVQGNPFYANLGDTNGAISSYTKSLAIFERLASADKKNVQAQRDLAEIHDTLGDMCWATGQLSVALDHYRKSLEIRQALVKDEKEAQPRMDLATSYERIGDTLAKRGDINGALESHRSALAIRESLAHQSPRDQKLQRALSISYGKVADMLSMSGSAGLALENYRKALAIREALVEQDPSNAKARRELSLSYLSVGDALWDAGDMTQALEQYRKALTLREQLSAADPANQQARRDVAIAYGNYGGALFAVKKQEEAISYLTKALGIFKSLSDDDPTNLGAREDLAICYGKLGDLMANAKENQAALKNYLSEVMILQSLVATDPLNASRWQLLAASYDALGGLNEKLATSSSAVTQRTGFWREARSWYQRSLDVVRNIQKRGMSTGAERVKETQLTEKIANCDRALAKLEGSARPR